MSLRKIHQDMIDASLRQEVSQEINNKVEVAKAKAQDYADIRFTELVGEAPATLDTIEELATMLQTLKADDVDGLIELLSRKVDVGDVGSLTSLQTNDKDSIVDAVNELFTEVDNGKKLVGDIIELKGGTVPTNPTFNDLTSAVMGLNTGGKKFATGVGVSTNVTARYYNNQGASVNHYSAIVTDIGFTPSTIVLVMKDTPFDGDPRVTATTLAPPNSNYNIRFISLSGSSIRLDGTSVYIKDGGFKLPYVERSSSFTWYAYE